jgi:N-acyl-D-aspartate/D-glutamate deacylase
MSVLIKNVRLFDGFDLHKGSRTVFVSDGIIQYIGEDDPKSFPSDTAIVDGSGCTLLPGLIDSHTHVVRNEDHAQRALQSGVTTLCDLNNVPGNATYMKQKSRTSSSLPQIFSTFTAATIPGGWPRAVIRNNSSDPKVLYSFAKPGFFGF